MTWIKTIPITEASPELLSAIEEQAKLYPVEYKTHVESLVEYENPANGPGIVMAHSLLPDTLKHTFSTLGTLFSPDLPLSRREHEMIAATVSSINSCFY
jgi:hypothetical protein